MRLRLFREVMDFLRKYVSYFRLVLILMIFGIILGLLIPQSWKMLFLAGMMQKIQAMGKVTVLNIFLNNLFVAVLLIIGGIVLFLPYLVIILNGVMLGALSPMLVSKLGGAGLIGGILPHGVFEITAFCLAGMAGIMVASRLMRVRALPDWGELWIRISQLFVLFIVPLLMLAALMEIYVSPWVSSALSRRKRPETSSKVRKNAFQNMETLILRHRFKKLREEEIKSFFAGEDVSLPDFTLYSSDGSKIVLFNWNLFRDTKGSEERVKLLLQDFEGEFALWLAPEQAEYFLFLWRGNSTDLRTLFSDLKEKGYIYFRDFFKDKEKFHNNKEI